MSSQNLTEEEIASIARLVEEEPALFEEMINRKKWTSVQKNPEKALKDMQVTGKYWNLLNNLPKKVIDSIITPSVLQMDKNTVDRFLKDILEEKSVEDNKKSMIQQERLISRNKTIYRHNQAMSDQQRLGVNISELEKDIENDISQFEIDTRFDKYGVEQISEFAQTKLSMKNSNNSPKKYRISERTELLAKPKSQFHGKDFFERQEFRGLFLADHQEIIKDKAKACVEDLNRTTVSNFSKVDSFKNSMSVRKTQSNFYKKDTKLSPAINNTYKSSAGVNYSSSKNAALAVKPDYFEDMDIELTNYGKFEGLGKRGESNLSYIEGTVNVKSDTFGKLNDERDKMARTFNQTSGGQKFLPQVVSTPLGLTSVAGMKSPQKHLDKSVYNFGKQLMEDYKDEQYENKTARLVTQVPKGGGKIDFHVRNHSDLRAPKSLKK